MTMFLPLHSEGKTLFDGESNLYQAKTQGHPSHPSSGRLTARPALQGHPSNCGGMPRDQCLFTLFSQPRK